MRSTLTYILLQMASNQGLNLPEKEFYITFYLQIKLYVLISRYMKFLISLLSVRGIKSFVFCLSWLPIYRFRIEYLMFSYLNVSTIQEQQSVSG